MISIIVPCYNSEKYLYDCLSSVTGQTYGDWEAICVDDGSKDRTGEILQEFASRDKRFRVIRQENAGVSAARNTGLRAVSGEYVCFVDSDDLLEPDYLENLWGAMSRDSVDLAVCGFDRSEQLCSPERTDTCVVSAGEWTKRIILDAGFHPQICCMLFKRKLIDDFRLDFIAGCLRGEDREFFMKYLLHASSVSYTDTPFYHYREHSGSAISSFNRGSLTSLEASERVTAYYSRYGSPLAGLIGKYELSRTVWKFLALALMSRQPDIYRFLKEKYDTRAEMCKLYDYTRRLEAFTARMYNFCEPLFCLFFYLSGFIKKVRK